MTEQEVFKAISEIVADRTDTAVEDIKNESTFKDLGIDSLDTVEVLMELEDKLGTSIELDQKIETIGDLDKFIQSKQGQ